MNRRTFAPALLALASILPCSIAAADASGAAGTPPAMTWSGSISAVNDYLWRGQSQTWGEAALQVGIDGKHSSGLYGGAWASNVSSQWVPGAYLETDWYLGYRGNLPEAAAGIGYDFNLLYVYYPSSNFDQTGFGLPPSSPTSLEASLALNYQWLTVKAGRMMTEFFGWNTANSGIGAFAGDTSAGVTGSTRGSYFFEASANYEVAPGWALSGQAGRQIINNSTGLDWNYYKVGVGYTQDNWTGSLAYSWTSEPDSYQNFLGLKNNGESDDIAQPRVVFSLTRAF